VVTRRRRTASITVVVGVLLALAVVTLGRLVWVHDHTWEWSLRPSATPPKLVVFDRDYRRTSGSPMTPTAAETIVGRTPGGGVILAARPDPYVPTGIWVRGPSGTVEYALMGSP
jgi:hypothetical protein